MRRGEVVVSAAELLDPASFPGENAFTAALRKTRRLLRLPRRCRVVLWGLPEGANRKDIAVKPMFASLTAAGFTVDRVVTPCNALAALARVKAARGDGATCWVAINRGGVAIVVVRPGEQVYAHSFVWDSSIGASGSQARLLQRYSLVSFLSPEVRRAIAASRESGYPVAAVVTCGNLPDLRSLTMPLIEELDVEVETLDSLDGLMVKPAAAERLTGMEAAIRLACAAAIARGTRPWNDAARAAAERSRALASAAALLLVLAGFGAAYVAYDRWFSGQPAPASRVTRPARPLPPLPLPRPPAVSVPATGPKSNPPAVSGPAKATAPGASPASLASASLLRDPMPRVTAILVANERRYATVDNGVVVGLGDMVGRREVIRIDERALTLREPSGVEIRVGLGGRLLSAVAPGPGGSGM